MANSIMVQLGFSQINDSLSNVLKSVNTLNVGIKDVVVGTKGLNNEVGKLGKQMAMSEKKNGLLKSIQKMASFTTVIQGFSLGLKSLYSGMEKSFLSVSKAAVDADKIYKTSQLVGFSVKDYQAFGSAAMHSGMEISEMDNALKKFNYNLGKARSGDKAAFKMFDSLIPKGTRLSDYKDSASLLSAIADGYQKLGSAEKKAFVTQELFGRGGAKMATLMGEGGDGIQKMLADYGNSGAGYSQKGAELARDFNDELQVTGELLGSFKITVMEELFPTFISFFKTIQGYIKNNGNELRSSIKETVSSVADFIKDLLPKIPVFLDKVRDLIKFVGPKKTLFAGLFLSALPAITQIIIGVKGLFVFMKSVVAPLIKIFAIVKTVVLWMRKWMVILRLVVALKGVALGVVGIIALKVAAVVAGITGWVVAIKSVIKNWNLVPDAIDWTLNTVKESIQWYTDEIGSFFKGVGEGIRDFVMGGLDTIYGAVQKIKGFLSGLFDGFPDKVKSFFGFGENVGSNNISVADTLGASAGRAVSESRTTVTNRFAVDFKNMPRGVVVTPPENGDFDYSRGYVLGGV